MRALGLRTAARLLQPLILFFSLFLLLQGHDSPGGGFVGGLAAASAMVLHAIAFGTRSARRSLVVRPETLAALGLALGAMVALAPLALGAPAFSAAWTTITPGGPDAVHVGTPLLFDLGIYVLVVGASLTIVFTLGEE
ncbi:MAG: hypothetical protein M5U28_43875 [Sandaracinaceae bacterium]|nr:hypothetical protein [Sandaracinaceae bacterium]